MNRAVKYLLILRNLITFKTLDTESVGSLYFIPAMIRMIIFCWTTVLNLLGRCIPKCDYNNTSMEIQKRYKVSKASLVNIVLAFIINPIPRATFPDMYEICFFQFILSSMQTPRNFVLSTSSMGCPSMLRATLGWIFLLCVKIIWRVFFTLRDNSLVFNQVDNYANSLLIVVCKCMRFLPLMNKFASSAYSTGLVDLQTLGTSFMNNKKIKALI